MSRLRTHDDERAFRSLVGVLGLLLLLALGLGMGAAVLYWIRASWP
jgi:hypothetical protein